MVLFGRNKEQSENSVNQKPTNSNGIYGVNLFFSKNGAWSDSYLWVVVQTIFNGLRNIQYTFPNDADNRLVDFLTNNIIYLIWLYWSYGYIVVGIDNKGNYYIPDNYANLKKDKYGRILGYECVYYSDKYRFENKSDFQIIRPILNELGGYKDAMQHLTNNLGCLGILTGKNLPVNPAEKEEFMENLKSKYGINSDKNNILLTTVPLDFSVMQFPADKLELSEKVKNCYTLICNYFQVPVDLIFGQSTYANQEQAVKNFYSNCISPLAEIVLVVGRHLVKMRVGELIPSTKLTFRIDNVPELIESVRTVDTDYVNELTDNIQKMKDLGLDTTKMEKVLKDYLNNIE